MSDTDIINQIKQSIQSADKIWNGNPVASPFLPNSSWIGLVATPDQGHLMDRILGNKAKTFRSSDPGFANVRNLIRGLLPPDGQALFDTGFDQSPIKVSPALLGWTPSLLACNLVVDIHSGTNDKFTEVVSKCGIPR